MPGGGVIHCRVTRLARAAAENPEIVKRAQETMAFATQAWADREGYEVLRVSWQLEQPEETEIVAGDDTTVKTLFADIYTLRMEATCRARWDGHWGEIRAALDEDGLLNPRDRADRPVALPGGFSGVATGMTFHSAAPAHPSPGDAWYDTTTAMVRIWDGDRWLICLDVASDASLEKDEFVVKSADGRVIRRDRL